MKFKTDEAAVDAARVLRLPGFYNMKTVYNPKPLVSVVSKSVGTRYSPSDFKIDITAETSRPVGVEAAPETIEEICAEIGFGLDEVHLNPTGKVTTGQWKYKFTFECPHPDHTATHTREVSVRSDGLIAKAVTARFLHTATLLNDGSVLVTGGADSKVIEGLRGLQQVSTVLSTTELFQ